LRFHISGHEEEENKEDAVQTLNYNVGLPVASMLQRGRTAMDLSELS